MSLRYIRLFLVARNVREEVGWWCGKERMGNQNENCRTESSPEI
jgi:hypothetical protein